MATQTAVESTIAQPGPQSGEVIVTENLWKTYEMGDQQVHALRGVDIRIRHN